MANQRPIRRGRIPFRRGRRWGGLSKALHPVRWLDCNSAKRGGIDPETGCETTHFESLCDPTTAIELLVGDLDWDWSDASEVRIDRIVGTVSWALRGFTTSAALESGAPFVMRFGILATEETDRVYNAVDLFDQESLEEFEWMWLEQRTIAPVVQPLSGSWYWSQTIDIPLDVRTRRKLGKKDSIVMYTQTRRVSTDLPLVPFTWTSNLTTMLRAIVRS